MNIKDPWVKASLEAPRVGKQVENLLWGDLCVFQKKKQQKCYGRDLKPAH